jgi:hypothetical protein
MAFYIELPPRGPLKTHEFKTPEQADRILSQIFKERRWEEGEHFGGVWICADSNCYSETEWPMNQYIAGVPGTVVLTNRGPGFTSGEISRACANVSRNWMTIDEAEKHRPPVIKMDAYAKHCRLDIFGTSTPQGMFSVDVFVERVQEIVNENGASLEIRHHEEECRVA